MIIRCSVCEAATIMEKPPLNNICPVCCHVGSLYLVTNPTLEELEKVKRLLEVENENYQAQC